MAEAGNEAPEAAKQDRKSEPGSSEPARLEPWLRGTHREIPAVARGVVHALELAREDAARWTAGLTAEQLHRRPGGLPSVAWQMRHIARSLDRLLSYAEGRQLSPEQMAALLGEDDPAGTLDELHGELAAAFDDGLRRVAALAGVDPETPRGVGRKALPTTVGGLLVHVADHTQRHTGQLVTTAKLVRDAG